MIYSEMGNRGLKPCRSRLRGDTKSCNKKELNVTNN